MAKSILQKVKHKVKKLYYRPFPKITKNAEIICLGTTYGGWSFADYPELYNSVIISCGLGEDASFDVEFAAKYNAKVVIVDPTPRAIKHFQEIQDRLGLAATCGYVEGGKQPVQSYDLSGLNEKHLQLVEKAMWIREERLKFFSPPNVQNVSHSINNFQNQYSPDTDHIEVDTVTIDNLMNEIGVETVPLLKMDIEAAEISVLPYMVEKGIKPRQLLIEFDEMNIPSARSKNNFKKVDNILKQSGYRIHYFDGSSNFLYIMDDNSHRL